MGRHRGTPSSVCVWGGGGVSKSNIYETKKKRPQSSPASFFFNHNNNNNNNNNNNTKKNKNNNNTKTPPSHWFFSTSLRGLRALFLGWCWWCLRCAWLAGSQGLLGGEKGIFIKQNKKARNQLCWLTTTRKSPGQSLKSHTHGYGAWNGGDGKAERSNQSSAEVWWFAVWT